MGEYPVFYPQKVTMPLLSALWHLHMHGLAHCTVTLDNVLLLGKNPRVVLTDFQVDDLSRVGPDAYCWLCCAWFILVCRFRSRRRSSSLTASPRKGRGPLAGTRSPVPILRRRSI